MLAASSQNNETNALPTKKLLEVGCGVGNFVFPLLEENKDLYIYACDFSERAVSFVKDNELYDQTRMKAFVCDLTQNPLVNEMEPESIDYVSAIFCLSAIPPQYVFVLYIL